jgi:hypothetical protein
MKGNIGDKATCMVCGEPIVRGVRFWEHAGDRRPRHPAVPADALADVETDADKIAARIQAGIDARRHESN